jgi:hypothetical protein
VIVPTISCATGGGAVITELISKSLFLLLYNGCKADADAARQRRCRFRAAANYTLRSREMVPLPPPPKYYLFSMR